MQISAFTVLLYKVVTSLLIYRSNCLTSLEVCKELSEFLPNLCSYKKANETCKSICHSSQRPGNALKCGVQPRKRFKRIVNGNISKPNQWPWHISLRLHDEHYCGGSILSKYFIVTAAHCIDEQYTRTRDIQDFKVIAGLHYRDTYNKSVQQVSGVKHIYKHKNYSIEQYPRKDLFFYVVESDIAIIELDSPLDLSNHDVQSICLPDNDNSIPDNYGCYVVGWGQTAFLDNASLSNELRFAEIKTTPVSICNEEKAFNNTVSSRNSVCGRGENFTISPCNKDSGGGMACMKDNRWYINGVVSSGFKCGDEDAYSLYTNTRTFKPWIIDRLIDGSTHSASQRLELSKTLNIIFSLSNIILLLLFHN